MKTIVQIHEFAEPSILRWFNTFGVGGDRVRMAWLFHEEIVRYLELHNGIISQAVQEQGTEPPTYWWEIVKGSWIRYCNRDEGGLWAKLTGKMRRTVLILEVSENPPDSVLARIPRT